MCLNRNNSKPIRDELKHSNNSRLKIAKTQGDNRRGNNGEK